MPLNLIKHYIRAGLAFTAILTSLVLFGYFQLRYTLTSKIEETFKIFSQQSGCSTSHSEPSLGLLSLELDVTIRCPDLTIQLKQVHVAAKLSGQMLSNAKIHIRKANIASAKTQEARHSLTLQHITASRNEDSITAFIKRAQAHGVQANHIQLTAKFSQQHPEQLELSSTGTIRLPRSIDQFTLHLTSDQVFSAGTVAIDLRGSPGTLTSPSLKPFHQSASFDEDQNESNDQVSHRAKVRATWQRPQPPTDRLTFRGQIRASLQGYTIEHPLLADEPVVLNHLELSNSFTMDLARRMLSLPSFQIAIADPKRDKKIPSDKLRMTGSLSVNYNKNTDQGEVKIAAHLPHTKCETLKQSLPNQLLGPLNHFTLAGMAGGHAELKIAGTLGKNTRSTPQVDLQLKNMQFDCHGTSQPLQFSREFLSRPFTIARPNKDENREPIHLFVHPDSRDFVPLPSISRAVIAAIILSEDRGFWSHGGIDFKALENAFVTNIAEKRFALGGSTITMQSAKNLFLSHKKTVSRKIQELFLAKQLEHVLTKQRILEIYLNIIEFGPNIFGIKKASEVYFNKHPYHLNPAEAAFLATLLPNPRERYYSFCHGSLTPGMRTLTAQVLERMKTFHLLHAEYPIDTQIHQVRFAKEAWKPNPCFKISQSQ